MRVGRDRIAPACPARSRTTQRPDVTELTASQTRTTTDTDHSGTIVVNTQQIREGLESRLGASCVRRYLGAGVDLAADERGLHVRASDRFTLDMIERRIGSELRSEVRDQLGESNGSVHFSIQTRKESVQLPSPTVPGRQAGNKHSVDSLIARQSPPQSSNRSTQTSKAPACPTLESYLVGKSNQLAFGAVKTVLESAGPCPPVYIHGGCGLGKTHLLRASAQRYRRMFPGAKVRYITGEAFTNSFVHAIRTKSVEAFEKKFKGLDVLCLDDVHMVAGKESTQHELLQIFNTLSLSGAKVLIASDAPPNEIARLSSGLASRFSGGVVARIDAPDRELGFRLAKQICIQRGISIDDAGLGTILDRTGVGTGASVRELEGAIVQVQAVSRLLDQDQNASMNLTSIHKALQLRSGSNYAAQSQGPIPIDLIIRIVLEHLGVSRGDLTGRGRHRTVVMARELIVHIARELTANSFPEIAHAIGRPNHSTVITAAKRIRGRIESNDRCRPNDPESGMTVGALVDELVDRVRRTHRQHAERA
jgi:chromosomal replication initiator protein